MTIIKYDVSYCTGDYSEDALDATRPPIFLIILLDGLKMVNAGEKSDLID